MGLLTGNEGGRGKEFLGDLNKFIRRQGVPSVASAAATASQSMCCCCNPTTLDC